jgi:hypothetical protein
LRGNSCDAIRVIKAIINGLRARRPPSPGRRAPLARTSPGDGACAFPIDPKLSSQTVTAFWPPEVLPTVVVLEPASSRFEGVLQRDIVALGGQLIEHIDTDGRHLVIRDHGELRLWTPHVPGDQPLSVVIPIDQDAETRIKRALRFWHWIAHPGSRITESFPLTQQQRDRLILMLRALDGRLAKASYREIAEALFGAQRLQYEAWKTSSLRDRTIRLVRGGFTLMQSGYRKLLRGK